MTPNESDVPIAAAILAGGASRRMGRDKATITFDGATMLETIVRVCRTCGLDVLVVGLDAGLRHDSSSMHERSTTEHEIGDAVERSVVFVPDEVPGAGPLAAIASALRSGRRELIVVACDMPCLDAEAISWLSQLTIPEHFDGLVVRNDDRLEFLFARYRLSCLALMDELLVRGERSLAALVLAGSFAFEDAPIWLGPKLANINTPDELEIVRRDSRAKE